MCIEIEATYEECVGMPGFGSIRVAMTARMELGEGYEDKDAAGKVRIMQMQMAASVRDRVEKTVDQGLLAAIERALDAVEKKGAAEQVRLQAAGERGERAAIERQLGHRQPTSAPAKALPAPRPEPAPRITERHWDGEQVQPPWEDENQDDEAPPGGDSQDDGPPSGGNGQQYGAPSSGASTGSTGGNGAVVWGEKGIPRTGFTLAGAMKNQPRHVKQRVWSLMCSAGRTAPGWTHQHEGKTKPVMFKDLNDIQVKWLTGKLSRPEPQPEPAVNGNGRY